MDFIPDNETFSLWLLEYGPIVLFGLLALEIIALPIPGEPLMILTGVLMSNGDLSSIPTLLAGYAGAICGISVSYILGRTAGTYLVVSYGDRLGLTNVRLQKVHDWFNRFGTWTLMIGYFIPGLRHFTGFTAGMATLEYRPFMIFAWGGAIIWVTTFLSLGYFFGDYWMTFFDKIMEFFS
ncbi:MAG: DedA family protein [Verrucomicrobia bacterium]|nr:DedA family protein [Verrucomicrobiota bacterium]MBS0636772.1 DedA family protein [Verrucomicrobiota bacterium]